MTDPLNIIFGIWLHGYRIEFSCLCLPQRYYLHKYCVAVEYRYISKFFIWSKSSPLILEI